MQAGGPRLYDKGRQTPIRFVRGDSAAGIKEVIVAEDCLQKKLRKDEELVVHRGEGLSRSWHAFSPWQGRVERRGFWMWRRIAECSGRLQWARGRVV